MIIPKSIPINFCMDARSLRPLKNQGINRRDFGHTRRVPLHLRGII